jgi:perosamine synthetase
MLTPKEPRFRLVVPILGEAELEAVRGVFGSGYLINGPATARFERCFAERHSSDYAVAMANGTVALAAIYLALGIGGGDEVIVPSMTFISTATSVLHVGAVPVFADVHPETFNLDPVDVARRLSSSTKAIVAVHYGGQPADLEELRNLADDAGVSLIEDAAEAHGATYRGRPVGSFGDAAMFSFTPTKNITMGEGGIVTTSDAGLAERLRLLRNHGQTAVYEHAMLGYNWRLTEMQAAIGEVQLGRLDGILARKRANVSRMELYLGGQPGLQLPFVAPDREHTYMLYTLLVDRNRDSVLKTLQEQGIEARIYFPPAHRQPVFEGFRCELPVTESLATRMLSIPFHAGLTDADLKVIADEVVAALGRETANERSCGTPSIDRA